MCKKKEQGKSTDYIPMYRDRTSGATKKDRMTS